MRSDSFLDSGVALSGVLPVGFSVALSVGVFVVLSVVHFVGFSVTFFVTFFVVLSVPEGSSVSAVVVCSAVSGVGVLVFVGFTL